VRQSKPVYEANLGKYDRDLRLPHSACPPPNSTHDPFAGERRLIVVGVIRKKPWAEDKLAAEVRRVFHENQTKDPIFKLILEGYQTNWSLARYKRK
jgi:hypothetical protein